jgi:hypothetical protein
MLKTTFLLWTIQRREEHRTGPRANRPAPRRGPFARWKLEKSEGAGFDKIHFLASSWTVWGAWPNRTRLLYLTSVNTFIALKTVDIAVFVDCCNFSRWCAGVDRLGQERGPSAVDRKWATPRKWLVAINTTPTTFIHIIQAFQLSTFNIRASTSLQDTFKALKLL